MHRKIRVSNPHYKPVVVKWSLMLDSPEGIRRGTLDFTFRMSEETDSKTVFSFPCDVSNSRFVARKFAGTIRKFNKDDRFQTEEPFSLVPALDDNRPMASHLMILNEITELIAKNCELILSAVKRYGVFFQGVTIIPPKVMRIPKRITVREISLEELQENEQF